MVYFLLDECDKIIYVGKSSSKNFTRRLSDHDQKKEFSSYFFIDGIATEEDALKLEGAFITLMQPSHNELNTSVSICELEYLIQWLSENCPDSLNKSKSNYSLAKVGEEVRTRGAWRARKHRLEKKKKNGSATEDELECLAMIYEEFYNTSCAKN